MKQGVNPRVTSTAAGPDSVSQRGRDDQIARSSQPHPGDVGDLTQDDFATFRKEVHTSIDQLINSVAQIIQRID